MLAQTEKLERQFNEPVMVKISEMNGRTLYRIVVGAFSDINQARQFNERVKAALGLSTFPVDLSKL